MAESTLAGRDRGNLPERRAIHFHSKFRALVISVHGGDEGCPVRNKSDLTAWKKEKCDFTVKWDEKAKQFVYKPL
jgi:hypothetical protein